MDAKIDGEWVVFTNGAAGEVARFCINGTIDTAVAALLREPSQVEREIRAAACAALAHVLGLVGGGGEVNSVSAVAFAKAGIATQWCKLIADRDELKAQLDASRESSLGWHRIIREVGTALGEAEPVKFAARVTELAAERDTAREQRDLYARLLDEAATALGKLIPPGAEAMRTIEDLARRLAERVPAAPSADPLAFTCPSCASPPGMLCSDRSLYPRAVGTHPARVQRAKRMAP